MLILPFLLVCFIVLPQAARLLLLVLPRAPRLATSSSSPLTWVVNLENVKSYFQVQARFHRELELKVPLHQQAQDSDGSSF